LAPPARFCTAPSTWNWRRTFDPDLKSWLAFAAQKLDELAILGRALNHGRATVADALAASAEAAERRRTSPKIHDAAVKKRLEAVTPDMTHRTSTLPSPARRPAPTSRTSALPDNDQWFVSADQTGAGCAFGAYQRYAGRRGLRGILAPRDGDLCQMAGNSVPAAAVIRGVQALFGIIGRKERVGGWISQM